MVSTAPNRLLVAVCLAVESITGPASLAATDRPAEQVLVFSARPGPQAGVRSIYKIAVSEPDPEARVIMTFKTGTGDIVDVFRDRYLVAHDHDSFVVYRFPEDSLTRFALPTTVGRIQQVGDDTVISVPWGRPRHASELTLLHLDGDPWIENKRLLTPEAAASARWSYVGKGAVSPDLKRVVFYLYPAADTSYQSGPPAPNPGASLVLVDFEGEGRIIAPTRYQDSPPKVRWFCDPKLDWLDDHRVLYTSDPYPGCERVPERWEPKPTPLNLVIDLATGETLPFTRQDEKVLQAQGRTRDRRRPARGVKLGQTTRDRGVLYDAATGREIFRTPTALSTPIMSPDGSMLVTTAPVEEGSQWRDIYVVDLRTGEARRVFRGYNVGIRAWMR